MYIQAAEFMLKSANFNSEYAKDELKQLQKMYRDKDLTEETEQMILKRYKHGVESADLAALHAKIEFDYAMKFELARREQALQNAVEKTSLALTRARDVQPLLLQQKKLALAHLKHDDLKAREHLADLEADRAALTIQAPADGIVYYGRFVSGQWMVPAGQQGPALLGTGQVTPRDVVLTLLSPKKIVIRAEAEEKELPGLKAALKGKLTPTAFPTKKIACEVSRVAAAPLDGKFEVAIKIDGKADGLMPGMTGSCRFVIANKKDTLSVPAYCVFEDPDDDSHHVYVLTRDGTPVKQPVIIGLTSSERTEIVKGVKDGDEVLTYKP
jgi:multidrug efflux pump subunit AcrA (membrane-fusion protein)